MNRIKLFLGSVQVMLFKDRLEVWNPGKLPQGMTIAKLNKEHTSNPVNPVLAHPVYLSGYIEQMGTGTTDIIDHCLDYGLRKPEFHQDDDFRVVLWRPEVQERGEERGKETGEVDDKMKRIILTIRGNTVSSAEINQSVRKRPALSAFDLPKHPPMTVGLLRLRRSTRLPLMKRRFRFEGYRFESFCNPYPSQFSRRPRKGLNKRCVFRPYITAQLQASNHRQRFGQRTRHSRQH